MGETQLQARIREQLGLRVGPEMAAYVLKQLSSGDGSSPIAVIASDARTGVPLRKELSPNVLRPLVAPASSA